MYLVSRAGKPIELQQNSRAQSVTIPIARYFLKRPRFLVLYAFLILPFLAR
jgi:hypothetical protein